MHDHSSKSSRYYAQDPLSEMLRGLRLDGVEYSRCRVADRWAIEFPQQLDARFQFIASGHAVLRHPQGPWQMLGPGDAVLWPRGGRRVVASAPDVPPVSFETYSRKEVCQGVFDVKCPDAKEGTVLLVASMRFNVDRMHPLLQLMPDVMMTSDL